MCIERGGGVAGLMMCLRRFTNEKPNVCFQGQCGIDLRGMALIGKPRLPFVLLFAWSAHKMRNTHPNTQDFHHLSPANVSCFSQRFHKY